MLLAEEEPIPPQRSGSGLRNVLLGVAAAYIVVSLYLMFDMHGRLSKVESAQVTAATNYDKLAGGSTRARPKPRRPCRPLPGRRA